MKQLSILVLVSLFCLPMTAMARRDTGPPEWTFDDVAELADWQDYHDLDPDDTITKVRDLRGSERNVFTIRATGDDPYIYPGGEVPSWEPFGGYDNRTIYIGVRVAETDDWRIDYITSREGTFDNAQSREFRVEATKDFVDLEFEMQWDDMISVFRIHPGTNRNKETEIDYVSLRGPVLVTQAPRRLSTTWGRIKDLF